MEIKSYVSLSDQGPYLNINEDKVSVNFKDNLFMILDGFGGAGVGDLAVEKVVEDVNTFYTKIGDDPDSTLPFFYNKKFLIEGNALINAVHLAHKNLVKHNFSRDMGARAGVAGIFISQSESLLSLVSVGNCKGFLLRNGVLEVLTIPDSYEHLSNGEGENNTFPLSALGLFDDLTYSTMEFRPVSGDILFFATEGCYWNLRTDEMRELLDSKELTPAEKVKRLVELANDKGNHRNQSALLLQY